MIATVITNAGLLPLLKRIQWSGYNGVDCCPECGGEETKYMRGMVAGHKEGCDLKAAINQLQEQQDSAEAHRNQYLESQA